MASLILGEGKYSISGSFNNLREGLIARPRPRVAWMNTVKMVVPLPLGKVKTDCAQYLVFFKIHWHFKKSIIRSYVSVASFFN